MGIGTGFFLLVFTDENLFWEAACCDSSRGRKSAGRPKAQKEAR